MKKKAKRYEEGGYTGDDPIVKYRMGMIDAQGNPIKKEEPIKASNYGEQDEMPETKAPAKAVERTVVKTKVTPATKSDWEDNSPLPNKKAEAVKELKEVVRAGTMPKSFTAAGGNTKATRSTESLPSFRMRMPDPLANFDAKGRRLSGRDTDDRRKGGAIKAMSSGGSASKRADGIAIRGKTRGKIC